VDELDAAGNGIGVSEAAEVLVGVGTGVVVWASATCAPRVPMVESASPIEDRALVADCVSGVLVGS
jgi:hypothetical protein